MSDSYPPLHTTQECVDLICGYQAPSYPFEDYVTLIEFGSWLRLPKSPSIQRHAIVAGTALLLTALRNGQLSAESDNALKLLTDRFHSFPLEQAICASPLALETKSPTFRDAYIAAENDIPCAHSVLDFIMACPAEHEPSVNKAIHFIESGGFVDASDTPEDKALARVSASKTKEEWSRYAVVTPFFDTLYNFEEFEDLLEITPDNLTSVRAISAFLDDRMVPREFFAAVASTQKQFIARLDPASVNRIGFATFTLEHEVETDHPQFAADSEDVKIIKKYRAHAKRSNVR